MKDESILMAVVLVALACLAFIMLDCSVFSDDVYARSAQVVDLQYSPAERSTGTGVGVGQDGSPVVVITSSSKSEKWIAIIQDEQHLRSMRVSAEQFYSLHIGDTVDLYRRVGGITGFRYELYIGEVQK